MSDQPKFDLDDARARLVSGAPVQFDDVDVIACRIHGRDVRFAVDMEKDPIQRNHRKGRFYEARELEAIRAVLPLNATFVDIGANVGNHSLYVGLFLSPARIIAIEPNPLAYRLLLANVALNGLGQIFDLSHIGIGLSDVEAEGFGMEDRSRNLGAAKMLPDAGEIALSTGDRILADEKPDMIKIDVEGMEMAVLAGLTDTLKRCSPTLFVEVDTANDDAFRNWLEVAGYAISETHQRYKTNRNYLATPI